LKLIFKQIVMAIELIETDGIIRMPDGKDWQFQLVGDDLYDVYSTGFNIARNNGNFQVAGNYETLKAAFIACCNDDAMELLESWNPDINAHDTSDKVVLAMGFKLSKLKEDERLTYPIANVFANAPLALIQVGLTAQIHLLEELLGLPLTKMPIKK